MDGLNGYFYEEQEDGGWKNTGRKIDNYNFDANGYYCEQQKDGKYIPTKFRRDPDGFDMYGINQYGFGRNGNYYNVKEMSEGTISIEDTGRRYNNQHFDINGFFWEEIDGEYQKTESKRDKLGCDIDGVNIYGFKRDGYYYEKKYGTYFKVGLRDRDGFDSCGINEHGFDREGFYYTKRKENVLEDDSDIWGDDEEECKCFMKETLWVNTGRKLNPYNFDINGDFWKTDNQGNFVNTGRKENDDGFKLGGEWRDSGSHLNPDNIDIDGYYWKENYKGKLYKTGMRKNSDGLFYIEVDGNKSINGFGFDKDGYYYKKQDDGTYIVTGLKYDENGFGADEKHVITKTYTDIRGFDVFGKCDYNHRRKYDSKGFKQDGTHKDTGEKYHNGYNAFGVDENGKDVNGNLHPDIIFAQNYINAVMQGKRKEFIEQHYKINNNNMNSVLRDIDIRVYRASEMYPEIKKTIANSVIKIQRAIQQREKRIQELNAEKTEEKEEIEKLQKQNAALKKRIQLINPMQGIEK